MGRTDEGLFRLREMVRVSSGTLVSPGRAGQEKVLPTGGAWGGKSREKGSWREV